MQSSKPMNIMETRIKELESEVEGECRRKSEVTRNLCKSQRRIMELAAGTTAEDHDRMQAWVDQLQSQMKTYKKQLEEAEEMAALNLARFRQVAIQLAEAEERADNREKMLAKVKVAKAK